MALASTAAHTQHLSCSTLCCSGARACSRLAAPPQLPQRGTRELRRAYKLARCPLAPVAALRAVESFDGSFQLEEQQQEVLNELLYSDLFCQQVVRDCKLPEGAAVEFTGVLFQPVPWSPATKKGMPVEVEQQYYNKPEYTIINVPPVFMFKAKIFQPPRLCAIYKRLDL